MGWDGVGWNGMGWVHILQQVWAEMYDRAHVLESWPLSSAPLSPCLNKVLRWCKCLGLHRVGRLQAKGDPSLSPHTRSQGCVMAVPVLGQLGARGLWMCHLTKGSVGDNIRETRTLVNVL